jgi:preprotein translocase subunit SecD
MAVDANVLIFERIREELRSGRTMLSAIESGYNRAFTTILDSNLTTLIAAILLFEFGSGPVRGFAVTLAIGLLTSMFTAILLTRFLIATWVAWRQPKALPL